jgi:hypothetical protein
LLYVEAIGSDSRKNQAAGAVRRARVEILEKREAEKDRDVRRDKKRDVRRDKKRDVRRDKKREQVAKKDKEKRDTKQYLKRSSLYK